MELRHLRYFVQVADDLHFARAATRLGVSQPPLSQQIRLLEEELGVRLIERSSRRVALTSAGSLFLEAARRTLAEANRAIAIGHRAARGEVGELRIGFHASAPLPPQVAEAIYAFRRRCPDIPLTLSELPRDAQVSALMGGDLDVGLMRGATRPVLPAELTAAHVLDQRLVVAMRPDHPLALRGELKLTDLDGFSLVLYPADERGGLSEQIYALLRDAQVDPPRVVQIVRETTALLGLVAAGVGITIVEDTTSALQSAGLIYSPLLDVSARTAMWLVHALQPSVAREEFVSIVQGLARDPENGSEPAGR